MYMYLLCKKKKDWTANNTGDPSHVEVLGEAAEIMAGQSWRFVGGIHALLAWLFSTGTLQA